VDRAPEFTHLFDPAMSPIDYEHFCAERLKLSGWSPTVTQASGDQGADIVASRGARTIVVQFKHYAKPVGNKAVQEVTAAMRHYSAEAGIVIAANGFTRAAEQLAASNGVTLLGHDDLTPHWELGDPQFIKP
jgi:restriction system protein